MTKSDLRVGDVVKTREGCHLVILPNENSKDGLATFRKSIFGCQCYLSAYDEDLTHRDISEYDIVAVYKASEPYKDKAYLIIKSIMSDNEIDEFLFDRFNWDWVRPEPVKEMTMAELEEVLGYKVKIVKEHTVN